LQLYENKMVNVPSAGRLPLSGSSPDLRRFDNPVMATQFETEPASRWFRIGELDGGVMQVGRDMVFNLLVTYAAMLDMWP
jgi:hypothetical protein